MGDVQRWTPEIRELGDFCDPEPGMAECRDGEWVSYDDHRAEVARMQARITELEAQAADVDHACRVLDERLRAMLFAVADVLEANGCDCECGHCCDDHDDDCERCLACRISDAVMEKRR